MTSSQYIVLKRLFPRKHTVVIFGPQQGKVLATAPAKILDFLWPGTVFNANLKAKQAKPGLLEQVHRKSMLDGRTLERLKWLQLLLRFCSQILPLEQACQPSYELLLELLEFSWEQVPAQAQKSIFQAFLLQLLNCNGFISGPLPLELANSFMQTKKYMVDAQEKSTLNLPHTITFLAPQHMRLLLEQIDLSLGRENLKLLLQLLEGI